MSFLFTKPMPAEYGELKSSLILMDPVVLTQQQREAVAGGFNSDPEGPLHDLYPFPVATFRRAAIAEIYRWARRQTESYDSSGFDYDKADPKIREFLDFYRERTEHDLGLINQFHFKRALDRRAQLHAGRFTYARVDALHPDKPESEPQLVYVVRIKTLPFEFIPHNCMDRLTPDEKSNITPRSANTDHASLRYMDSLRGKGIIVEAKLNTAYVLHAKYTLHMSKRLTWKQRKRGVPGAFVRAFG